MKLMTNANGRQYQQKTDAKTGKVYRYYVDEGKVAEDYWTDIETLNYEDAEQIGYPTQKPYRLLERIINSSSENGDVVADFFCGGGTTLSAAQRLGRRWIGCDISRIAVAITADRVTNIAIQSNNGGNQAVQQTIVPTSDISIEYWGIYEIPSLTNLNDNEFRRFVISAYNGRYASAEEKSLMSSGTLTLMGNSHQLRDTRSFGATKICPNSLSSILSRLLAQRKSPARYRMIKVEKKPRS